LNHFDSKIFVAGSSQLLTNFSSSGIRCGKCKLKRIL
jgi:hypothetical protein